jgi:hypothetical protein
MLDRMYLFSIANMSDSLTKNCIIFSEVYVCVREVEVDRERERERERGRERERRKTINM